MRRGRGQEGMGERKNEKNTRFLKKVVLI